MEPKIQEIYRVRLDRGDLLLETILDTMRSNDMQDGAVQPALSPSARIIA